MVGCGDNFLALQQAQRKIIAPTGDVVNGKVAESILSTRNEKTRKERVEYRVIVVEPGGIEPPTLALRTPRSPN